MQIERAEIPAGRHLGRHGKYNALWEALSATEGAEAVMVRGLSAEEVQCVRSAARHYQRNLSDFKFASTYVGGVLTCWLIRRVPVTVPAVSRTLTAIR